MRSISSTVESPALLLSAALHARNAFLYSSTVGTSARSSGCRSMSCSTRSDPSASSRGYPRTKCCRSAPRPISLERYPDGLQLRQLVEHGAAVLAAETGLFVAAVWARGVEAVVRVDPHRARAQARCERVGLSDVPRPY